MDVLHFFIDLQIHHDQQNFAFSTKVFTKFLMSK